MKISPRTGGQIDAVARSASLLQQPDADKCRRYDESRSRVSKKRRPGLPVPCRRSNAFLPPVGSKKNGGASEPRAKPSTVVPISRRPRVSLTDLLETRDWQHDPQHTRRTTRPSQIYVRTIFRELTDRTASKSRTAKAGDKGRVATVRVSLTNESHFANLQQIVN